MLKKQADLEHKDALNATKHRKLVMDNLGALNLAFGINASRPHDDENKIKYLIGTTKDLFEALTILSEGLNNAITSQNAKSATMQSDLHVKLNKLAKRCAEIEALQKSTLSKVAPPEIESLRYRYNLSLGKKIDTVIAQLEPLESRIISGSGATTTSNALNAINSAVHGGISTGGKEKKVTESTSK
jgi:hypothetical protein